MFKRSRASSSAKEEQRSATPDASGPAFPSPISVPPTSGSYPNSPSPKHHDGLKKKSSIFSLRKKSLPVKGLNIQVGQDSELVYLQLPEAHVPRRFNNAFYGERRQAQSSPESATETSNSFQSPFPQMRLSSIPSGSIEPPTSSPPSPSLPPNIFTTSPGRSRAFSSASSPPDTPVTSKSTPTPIPSSQVLNLPKLHRYVIEQNVPKIREKLAKVKHKVNQLDEYRRTPLHYIAWCGMKDIMKEWFELRPPSSVPAKKWDIPDVNVRDVDGKTPLLMAVERNQLETLRILLEHEADPNITDNEGNSALHYAVDNENMFSLKLLIEAKSDVNIKNKEDCSPLHLAAAQGSLGMVRRLLLSGANLNSQDLDDRTPLHLASELGNVPMVAFMLEKGANPILMDVNGRTPASYAKQKNVENLISEKVLAMINLEVKPEHVQQQQQQDLQRMTTEAVNKVAERIIQTIQGEKQTDRGPLNNPKTLEPPNQLEEIKLDSLLEPFHNVIQNYNCQTIELMQTLTVVAEEYLLLEHQSEQFSKLLQVMEGELQRMGLLKSNQKLDPQKATLVMLQLFYSLQGINEENFTRFSRSLEDKGDPTKLQKQSFRTHSRRSSSSLSLKKDHVHSSSSPSLSCSPLKQDTPPLFEFGVMIKSRDSKIQKLTKDISDLNTSFQKKEQNWNTEKEQLLQQIKDLKQSRNQDREAICLALQKGQDWFKCCFDSYHLPIPDDFYDEEPLSVFQQEYQQNEEITCIPVDSIQDRMRAIFSAFIKPSKYLTEMIDRLVDEQDMNQGWIKQLQDEKEELAQVQQAWEVLFNEHNILCHHIEEVKAKASNLLTSHRMQKEMEPAAEGDVELPAGPISAYPPKKQSISQQASSTFTINYSQALLSLNSLLDTFQTSVSAMKKTRQDRDWLQKEVKNVIKELKEWQGIAKSSFRESRDRFSFSSEISKENGDDGRSDNGIAQDTLYMDETLTKDSEKEMISESSFLEQETIQTTIECLDEQVHNFYDFFRKETQLLQHRLDHYDDITCLMRKEQEKRSEQNKEMDTKWKESQSTIKNYEKQTEDLQAILEINKNEHQRQLQTLEGRCKKLREETKLKDEDYQMLLVTLLQANHDHNFQNQQWRQLLNHITQQHETIRHSIQEHAKHQQKDLEKKFIDLSEEQTLLRSRESELETNLTNCLIQNRNLKVQVESLEMELKTTLDEKGLQEVDLNTMKTKLTTFKQQLRDESDKLKDKESELLQVQMAFKKCTEMLVAKHQEEAEKMQKELSSIKEKNQALEVKFQAFDPALEGKNTELIAKAEELQAELQRSHDELSHKENEMNLLRHRLEEVEQQWKVGQGEITHWQQEANLKEKYIEQSSVIVSQLDEKVKQTCNDNLQLQNRLEEAGKLLQQQEKEHQRLKEENSSLLKMFEEWRTQHLHVQHDEMEQVTSKTMAKLNETLLENKVLVRESEKEIIQLRQLLKLKQGEVETSEESLAQVKDSLQLSQIELEKAQQEAKRQKQLYLESQTLLEETRSQLQRVNEQKRNREQPLQQPSDASPTEKQQWEEQRKTHQEQTNKLSSDITALQTSLDILEKEKQQRLLQIHTLEEQVASLINEAQKKSNHMQQLEIEHESMMNQLKFKEKEIQDQQEKEREAWEKVATLTSEQRCLSTQLQEKTHLIQVQEQSQDQQQAHYQELQLQLQHEEQQLQHTKQEVDSLQAQLQAQEKELLDTKFLLETSQHKIVEQKDEMDKFLQESEDLKLMLENMFSRLLQAEEEGTAAAAAAAIAAATTLGGGLRALSSSQSMVCVLEEIHHSQSEKCVMLEERLQLMEQEKQQWETQIQELQDEIQLLRRKQKILLSKELKQQQIEWNSVEDQKREQLKSDYEKAILMLKEDCQLQKDEKECMANMNKDYICNLSQTLQQQQDQECVLKEEISNLTCEKEKLQLQLTAIECQRDEALQEIISLKQTLSVMTSKLEQMQQDPEKESLQLLVTETKAMVKSEQEQKSVLSEKLGQMQQELASLHQQIRQQQNQLDKVIQESQCLQKQLVDQSSQDIQVQEVLKEKVMCLEHQLNVADANHENVQSQLNTIQEYYQGQLQGILVKLEVSQEELQEKTAFWMKNAEIHQQENKKLIQLLEKHKQQHHRYLVGVKELRGIYETLSTELKQRKGIWAKEGNLLRQAVVHYLHQYQIAKAEAKRKSISDSTQTDQEAFLSSMIPFEQRNNIGFAPLSLSHFQVPSELAVVITLLEKSKLCPLPPESTSTISTESLISNASTSPPLPESPHFEQHYLQLSSFPPTTPFGNKAPSALSLEKIQLTLSLVDRQLKKWHHFLSNYRRSPLFGLTNAKPVYLLARKQSDVYEVLRHLVSSLEFLQQWQTASHHHAWVQVYRAAVIPSNNELTNTSSKNTATPSLPSPPDEDLINETLAIEQVQRLRQAWIDGTLHLKHSQMQQEQAIKQAQDYWQRVQQQELASQQWRTATQEAKEQQHKLEVAKDIERQSYESKIRSLEDMLRRRHHIENKLYKQLAQLESTLDTGDEKKNASKIVLPSHLPPAPLIIPQFSNSSSKGTLPVRSQDDSQLFRTSQNLPLKRTRKTNLN